MASEDNSGKVKFFNVKNGYGIIVCNQSSRQIFFSHRAIATSSDEFRTIADGQEVEFGTVGEGEKGFYTTQVTPVGDILPIRRHHARGVVHRLQQNSDEVEFVPETHDSRKRHNIRPVSTLLY